MSNQQTGAEQTARASTAKIQWIELTAFQRDLLELFYRQDRQSDTENLTLTDAVVADELIEWYGDVVSVDRVESLPANLIDRSLLAATSARDEGTEVEDALTSAGRLLIAGRVVSLASLLTDDEIGAEDTATLEGQS